MQSSGKEKTWSLREESRRTRARKGGGAGEGSPWQEENLQTDLDLYPEIRERGKELGAVPRKGFKMERRAP